MSPYILLSYATWEQLGILQFNVPNLLAQEHIDTITFPTTNSLGKTTKLKMVTFKNPLTTKIPQTHWYPSISPSSSRSLGKTMKTVTFKDPVKDHPDTCYSPSLSSNIWPKSVLKASKPQAAEASSTPQLRSALKPHKPDPAEPTISPIVEAQDIVALKCDSPSLFDTISNMPSTYTIRTNPNIAPIQHARRKVPKEYWEQIECILNYMVTKGLIVPVSWPAEWVSSLIYPCKSNGSLHIFLDPKDLNKTIVWEHYKALTLEEISHCLNGATCFSKLDAKDGFWRIHLNEQSSYLTTFYMYHGRYRFLYVPFGLKMSQDIFQMCMDQAMHCLPGIINIHDNICIYAHTPEEHDQHLLKLMQTAVQIAIAFNSSKCQIREPQIVFNGAAFITKGM